MNFKSTVKIKGTILTVLSLLFLSGCASSQVPDQPNTSSDAYALSSCAQCKDKKIFYKNGVWVK